MFREPFFEVRKRWSLILVKLIDPQTNYDRSNGLSTVEHRQTYLNKLLAGRIIQLDGAYPDLSRHRHFVLRHTLVRPMLGLGIECDLETICSRHKDLRDRFIGLLPGFQILG